MLERGVRGDEAAAADLAGGEWSADAELSPQVGNEVTPGTYTSTLTPSLFDG